MIRRIRAQLGPAGFVVAIVALIAALAGGAYAASGGGLTGKQKKEVKTIAKSFQGTGPAGAQGPAGSAGAKGSTGADGAKGDPGAAGTNGKDGTSVTTSPATPAECPSGGIKVAAGSAPAAKVCNGLTGFAEELPSEATETGTWSYISTEPGQFVAVGFSTPLSEADADAIEVEFISAVSPAPTANCPGSAANPQAVPGVLCFYTSAYGSTSTGAPTGAYKLNGEKEEPVGSGEFEPIEEEGVTSAGTLLYFENINAGKQIMGSYAVTAP